MRKRRGSGREGVRREDGCVCGQVNWVFEGMIDS